MSEPPRRAIRRHATTLVLVALALGAGLWLMVAEQRLPSTAEQEARRGNLLPSWRRDALTRVELVSLAGAFALVRDPDGASSTFRIQHRGRDLDADPAEVDRLLAALELAEVRREVAETSIDRAAMGLDAPRVRVTVSMGAITHRVAVGAGAPGDAVYAEVEGRGVFVVPTAVADALTVGPDALRDRTIVPLEPRAVARWTLEGEGGTRRLVRASWPAAAGGAFRLADEGPRVAEQPLEAALDALGRMRAEVFPAGDGPLEEPRLTITLEPTEGPRTVVSIGGACPDADGLVVVHRSEPSPLRACVPATVVPPLLRTRSELVDHHLVGARLDAIVELRITRGSEVLEMARKGAGFHVRSPEPAEVPEAAARALLDALVLAEGDLEPAAGATFDGEGSAVIRVASRPGAPGDRERVETVRLGPPGEGHRWALREEDGAVLRVDEAAVRTLLAPELVLRERKVIDVAPERVREVAVEGARMTQHIRRAGAGVELVLPRGRGLEADDGWGLELMERVARLEAVRWVASRAEPSFALDPPRFTLAVTIEGDAAGATTTRTITFGAPTEDGPFARIDGSDAVFVAPLALEEAALRWLVDRGSFRVRVPEVAHLIVKAPGARPLALTRVDGTLVVSGDDVPDGPARAARVREGIDELAALEAVAIGAGRPEHGLEEAVVELEVTPTEGAPFRLVVGASDAVAGESVHYARRSDVGAVFTVGRGAVRSLLEAVR